MENLSINNENSLTINYNNLENFKSKKNENNNDLIRDDNLIIDNNQVNFKNILKCEKKINNKVNDIAMCQTHGKVIEFICLNKSCVKELCSYCVLEHKVHLNTIKLISVITESICNNGNNYCNYNNIKVNVNDKFITLDELKNYIYNKILDIIKKHKLYLTKNGEKMFSTNNKKLSFLKGIKPKMIKKNNCYDFLLFLKENFNEYFNNYNKKILIDINIIEQKIDYIINNNLVVNYEPSACNNLVSIVYWFEWGTKYLNIFNIEDSSFKQVSLPISFKIPLFSRSVITDNSSIFLLGGEDNDTKQIQNIVYNINPMGVYCEIKFMSRMPVKKYDFSVCYIDNYIYIVSGKNENHLIVNSCERYDIINNSWKKISNCIHPRFASLLISDNYNKKLFLFGGRFGNNNKMVEEIEEYDIERNTWKVVTLKNKINWKPVEISAGIQISKNMLLIFGGSDENINDIEYCYLFNTITYEIKKIKSIKKANVFINSPLKYGNNIYCVGNKYYVKNRNIHKFDLDTYEWSLLF